MRGFYSIRLHDSRVVFPGTNIALQYCIDPSLADGIDIWEASSKTGECVNFTTLEVASGGGKSTLAQGLFDFLTTLDGGQFLFGVVPPNKPSNRLDDTITSMIPQRPNTVLHWRPRNILPKNSKFLECVFTQKDTISRVYKDRFSKFSGGQAARILVASSLERLLASGARHNFLILDEAFEGVDAEHANKILRRVQACWSDLVKGDRILNILLVSHLDAQSFTDGLRARRLVLSPEAPIDIDIDGRVFTTTTVGVRCVS